MIQSKAFRRFGVVLPLVLLVIVVVVSAFGIGEEFIFNPLGLILVLHTIFLTVIGIIVATVSARSYLRQGNLSILLLGTAALTFACAGLLGGILLSNYGTIINNIGMCGSSVVQVMSAIAALVTVKSIQLAKGKTTLAAAYLGVVVFITALTALTFSGVMPVFLSPQGPTLVRTTVLGVTVFLFASSCFLFFWRYRQSKVNTLYWYSLALGLFAIAFLSFMLQIQLADSFGWIGRVAEYSGGIFFIVALLQPAVGVEGGADLSGRWAEAFRGNRAQFAALFSNMLDAFVYGKAIVDENGKPVDTIILEVNDAFEKITGIKKENAIGKKSSELVPGVQNDPAGWIAIYGHVAITGEPAHFENYLQALNKWYHVSSYSPKKGYFVSIFEDITERKKAEAALNEYKANLEKLVEERTKQLKESERMAAIGATAGMVGHDIRNPLQAITSDIYLAKTELALMPETEEKKNTVESLTEIEKNIDYINKIVQDLQDYARPLNPQMEESDLRQIVESLFVKNGFPENVEVKVDVAKDTRKIRVDAYYLNRILFNLVTNAVQAMPQGGKLTIDAHKEENDTVITVADTGVGIPKAIQEKMFTLMFTTKSKGQGFGLPVVKRMIESLGGTVSFESEEGKGTKFMVRLPPPRT